MKHTCVGAYTKETSLFILRPRGCLEAAYACNAVSYMLSGKAVQRAVRGHLIAKKALGVHLPDNPQDVQIPTDDDKLKNVAVPEIDETSDNDKMELDVITCQQRDVPVTEIEVVEDTSESKELD